MRMFYVLVLLCGLLLAAQPATAQEQGEAKAGAEKAQAAKQQQGPPPALVVTAKAAVGVTRPQTEFVGAVYFPEVADVASEVSGLVRDVAFEEGGVVKKGDLMVSLNTDLRRKALDAALAAQEQAKVELERSELNYGRTKELFAAKTVSEQEYDNARLSKDGSAKSVQVYKAQADQIRLELKKMNIYAPFTGVVLDKAVAPGEYVSPASPVARLARNDEMDVIVDVPQEVLRMATPGQNVTVRVNGDTLQGTIIPAPPRGDVATRSFPVKIRIPNPGLAEGMEARVRLASGPEIEAVMVPRDAVIQAYGQWVVWIAAEGKAVQIPVEVAAYDGDMAAIKGQSVAPGAAVVIKGNERLRPGQNVLDTGAKGAQEPPKEQ